MKNSKIRLLSLCLSAAVLLQGVPVSASTTDVTATAAETDGAEFTGAEEPVYTPVVTSDTKVTGAKNGDTTLDMELYARYNSGAMNADGGSLEIVEYNAKNGYAYAVSGVKGKIIAVKIQGTEAGEKVTDLSAQGTEIDVKALVEGADAEKSFAYGDMTSVAISPDGTKLAAAIQHVEYDKAGKIAVFTCKEDGTLSDAKLYNAGVQPDMVTFANDNTVLSADEGEPRNGYGEGMTDPAGTVTILNLTDGSTTQAGFTEYDSKAAELTASNILLGKIGDTTFMPSTDFEPEYIAVSADGTKAYVALQEANAIAVLDISEKKFTGIYSAGFEDYSKVAVDLVEDETYKATVYENLVGARMPDGISIYEKDGKTYLLTANEGDAREWGDYINEAKTKDFTGKNIRIIDETKCAGLPEGKSVMFGGRGFTIFEVTEKGLNEVYDSGNDFETITAEVLPDYFNCSNDDIEADSRSGKKGPEPENITVGTLNGRTYAFIAVERIGGIMAYDITNPAYSMCVNYINSRDFSEDIKGDVSPEGICFIKVDGKTVVLAACEVSGTLAAYELTGQAADDIVVLYTNDVHNAYERSANCLGYASVAQYKKQLESLGYEVELVDMGDAIQGGIIGTLSKGQYIVDIMEKTGYDIAIPGNHEFDFGMENFLNLASGENKADYAYISCNFVDLRTGKTVLEPYKIVTYGDMKVAYVGVTTPETFTKSTPTYFQDKDGNYIYGFCEGDNGQELYTQVQNTVDAAKEAGADYVVVLGHVGVDEASTPWTSKEIIANTTGIDVFLDGHSHSTIKMDECTDKEGNKVLLSSTGTALTSLGELRIDKNDKTAKSSLVTSISMEDAETLAFVKDTTAKFEEKKNEKVAESEISLVINDPETGKRLVRYQETNLGDLCADAYRTLLGADVAFVNGGGVRKDIAAGDITYGDIINVHPFGNAACLIEATGQQILDALELGASAAGVGESGGFLQVSGLTYDIDTQIPSSVKVDDKKMFIRVEGDYRVKNVKIGGKDIELDKTYTLASHNYMLKSGGDGYTMFMGNRILQDEVLIDNQVLINYITENLGGKITADSIYGNPYGEGRIHVITESKAATCTEDGYVTYLKGANTVTETRAKSGHTIVIDPAVEATETQTGKTEGSHCSVCGAIVMAQQIIPQKSVGGNTPVKESIALSKENVALSKAGYTYDGKTHKPSVTVKDSAGKTVDASNYTVEYAGGGKKVGIYTVTITGKGDYTGTVCVTYTILPKSTSITKLSAAAKKFTVKWKKQTKETTGYQVQYSTDKKFSKKTTISKTVSKNKTTSLKVTKLKAKKKYYVRVRTYKTVKVGGKSVKIYGNWSKGKTVTTK